MLESLDILQHFGTNSLTFPMPRAEVPSTQIGEGETCTWSCRGAIPVFPIAHRRTGTLGRKILVSDAQKHVLKAPVYSVHLHTIIVFLSSLNGVAVL